MVNLSGKPNHPTSPSANPYHKVKGDTSWGGITILRRNEFINFEATTKEGRKNSIFASANQPDYTPMLQFYDTTFTDVDGDALAKLADPNPAWANVKDCGDWPCTGPLNVLYSFKNSKIKGSTPGSVDTDFQIIANNEEFAPHVDGCSLESDQNAYFCQTKTLGILLFDSLDGDRMDRTVSPVYIRKQGTDINNKLNTMMDHSWDGFYSSQKRQTRFPTIVDVATEGGSIYDIVYTGTPPNKQLFKLEHQDPNVGMTIRIAYPNAGSFAVMLNKKLIPMNKWRDDLRNYGPITQTKCGENRFLGIQNVLELYISSQCTLEIEPRDAIQTAVRMEWTLKEFYNDGGTTKFVDRLAATLGIHAGSIKVVGVYEGSVILKYDIIIDEVDGEPEEEEEETVDDTEGNTDNSNEDDSTVTDPADKADDEEEVIDITRKKKPYSQKELL